MKGSSTPGSRPLGPIAMIAAPTALLAAMLVHPAHGMDASSWVEAATGGPARFYLAHLLIWVAVALFVPAALGLADLARSSRADVAAVGSALTLLGLIGIAVLIGFDFALWHLARSPQLGEPAVQALGEAPLEPGVLVPLSLLIPGLVLGPGLLSQELYRQGAMPLWRATLIPLGLVGVFAGLPIPTVAIAGALALLVALGGLGLELLRAGLAPAPTPRSLQVAVEPFTGGVAARHGRGGPVTLSQTGRSGAILGSEAPSSGG